MANFYRQQVDTLREALQSDVEGARLEAAAALRALIKDIVLTPEGGEVRIDVRGDLAGILKIALGKQRPRVDVGSEQAKLVAGSRSHLDLRSVADLVEQVEMVAGARIGRDRHLLTLPI